MNHKITVLLIALCVSACKSATPTAMPCNQLLPSSLSSIPFEKIDRNDVLAWVENEFGIKSSSVDIFDDVSGGRSIVWKDNQKEFDAFFQSANLTKITVTWTDHKPTLQNVLNCMGTPDSYRSTYKQDVEGRAFMLELWYPRKGAVVGLTQLVRGMNNPPTIDETLQFDVIEFTKPGGTPGDIAEGIYPQLGPSATSTLGPSFRSWPSKLEDVRVDQ
jgi:hypothetical protein